MCENKIDYYKGYVLGQLNEGDKFFVNADYYNTQGHMKQKPQKRKVVRFYKHYVLTIDVYGRRETFQYYDLYQILRGTGEDDETLPEEMCDMRSGVSDEQQEEADVLLGV